MGQPPLTDADGPPPEPIRNVPAGCAESHPAGGLVLRACCPADVGAVHRVDPDRIAWIEAPLDLAGEAWPAGVRLDVGISDPTREAPGLHPLSRLRGERPLRVTLPVTTGLARAARVAMSLQLPLRLLPGQPSPDALGELRTVFESYLHDPRADASVQPFDAVLAFLLHGEPVTAWTALDLDPFYVCRFPAPGEPASPADIPPDPGFVEHWVTGLVASGAECAGCPYLRWCAGIFKWPDQAYACDAVKRFLAAVGESAEAIARDLGEAEALTT
ncbi:MAG: hypothetical protein KA419_10350 [Acidobacteria bacterium]|nr:hypothetical protein [Acidobacteriota bacterium]